MLDNPVKFRWPEVGQGDVVAVEEGEAVVLVLDVQRLAQAFGKLVDETEDAVVAAAGRHRCCKRQTQRRARFPLDLKLPQFAVLPGYFQQQLLLG